MDLKNMIAK